MKKNSFIFMGLFFIGFISIIAFSCGGGDDESQSKSSTPATLDEENVDNTLDYIVETIPGCTQGGTAGVNQALLSFVSTMKQTMHNQIQLSYAPKQNQPAAEEQPPIVLEGTCGGTITITITGDETTGEISGSILFEDYCQGVEEEGTVVINGEVVFSGTIDPVTGDITQLSGSSTGITVTVTEGDEESSMTIAFNGTLTIGEETIILNLPSFTFIDQTRGIEISLQDFSVTITQVGTSYEIVVSGTLIVTGQGSVQFTTDGPILITEAGEVTEGSITVIGANNTKMQITFLANGIVAVQADTDGDGTYDYFPEDLDCSELDLDIPL